MLDAHCQQAVGGQLLLAAIAVQVAHGDGVGAGDVGEDPGDRQAALLVDLLALAGQDLRVHEHQRLVLALADVDDHEPVVGVDLGRRQADARGGVHGLEHVVDQTLELRAGQQCRVDRGGHGAQARVGELEDRQLGHGRTPETGEPAQTGLPSQF